MTRRLHEFKVESGTSMAEHPNSFGELAEYDSILENAKGITLIEVKEKLLKESEKLQRKGATEKAFHENVNARRFKGGRNNGRKGGPSRENGGFKGNCFNCDQFGHRKWSCPASKRSDTDDTVFAVGEEKSSGWLVDSGATFHMTPQRKDLFDNKGLGTSIEAAITDEKNLLIKGAGTVKLTGLDGKGIRMVQALHIPGIDRRLLSGGKLAEIGMSADSSRSSCVI
ncbi:FOG: Transposon-encoded proteins with TYA, reverse transcriptase, integrase domains in various combinations [Plasmopara halstedii]|uniref:FOG: Transposon-encoded proteins with TYA, reverse transcriptase, integrase domains in various combinations n=1 Tax=Plasmopara halstedii TaxID=4781 RepID=A0A0P1AXC3_PLAHL|nr:FOG: Transposon-encoded proteins with TYA, reverse transcriptase, integrase domains in various combinations [Plasmopara halstedii]CEG46142.1 FOG: Transposon-encoded proteins with TYA, reverse transcriptase, integrase domains in various combinations [Plasmopara halstedii]|eukprot:XP_024582511.1 FOG: Transposon-encoded proteins with TYA, reverse transcriptase, integrase domains in various combinations [Plasmopara halstedii]